MHKTPSSGPVPSLLHSLLSRLDATVLPSLLAASWRFLPSQVRHRATSCLTVSLPTICPVRHIELLRLTHSLIIKELFIWIEGPFSQETDQKFFLSYFRCSHFPFSKAAGSWGQVLNMSLFMWVSLDLVASILWLLTSFFCSSFIDRVPILLSFPIEIPWFLCLFSALIIMGFRFGPQWNQDFFLILCFVLTL